MKQTMTIGISFILLGIIILLEPLFNLDRLVWFFLILGWLFCMFIMTSSEHDEPVKWCPGCEIVIIIMGLVLPPLICHIFGTNNVLYTGAAICALIGVLLIFHSLLTKPRVGTEPKVALHASEDDEYKVHTDE